MLLYLTSAWLVVRLADFFDQSSAGTSTYMIVYVDDIVITEDDQEEIVMLKKHLFDHFSDQGSPEVKTCPRKSGLNQR